MSNLLDEIEKKASKFVDKIGKEAAKIFNNIDREIEGKDIFLGRMEDGDYKGALEFVGDKIVEYVEKFAKEGAEEIILNLILDKMKLILPEDSVEKIGKFCSDIVKSIVKKGVSKFIDKVCECFTKMADYLTKISEKTGLSDKYTEIKKNLGQVVDAISEMASPNKAHGRD